MGPYEKLFIYEVPGEISLKTDAFGRDFIGCWNEGGSSFLFFSRENDEEVREWLTFQDKGLALGDRGECSCFCFVHCLLLLLERLQYIMQARKGKRKTRFLSALRETLCTPACGHYVFPAWLSYWGSRSLLT